jgi:hypothetical protein
MTGRVTLALLCAGWVAAATGCDDEDDSLPTYLCNAQSCDPVCMSLITHPPDPVRSRCSPEGPICDYDLSGHTWEYACAPSGHIECNGTCPMPDLGAVD